MKMKFFIFTFIFLALVGCSKKEIPKEPIYTAEEFMKLAHAVHETHEKGQTLTLSDYSPGVIAKDSVALVFERLTFFAVEFETVEEARKEAIRLNQYHARNWLLDRVEGEPILEDYVISTFKALNPKRKVQRVPKVHAPEHGDPHASSHEAPAAHH